MKEKYFIIHSVFIAVILLTVVNAFCWTECEDTITNNLYKARYEKREKVIYALDEFEENREQATGLTSGNKIESKDKKLQKETNKSPQEVLIGWITKIDEMIEQDKRAPLSDTKENVAVKKSNNPTCKSCQNK